MRTKRRGCHEQPRWQTRSRFKRKCDVTPEADEGHETLQESRGEAIEHLDVARPVRRGHSDVRATVPVGVARRYLDTARETVEGQETGNYLTGSAAEHLYVTGPACRRRDDVGEPVTIHIARRKRNPTTE